MKKVLKVLGYFGLTAFVFLFVAVAFLLYKLPSQNQIQEMIHSIKAQPESELASDKTASKAPVAKSKEEAATTLPIQNSSEKNPGTKSTVTERKNLGPDKVDKLIQKMVREDISKINICENLESAAKSKSVTSEADVVNGIIDDYDNQDPLMTSLKLPIYAAMQQEPVKSFIEEVMQQPKGQDEAFLIKMGFYKKALDTYNFLQNEKPNLEKLSDRAYHLYVISKAVQKKPSLAKDPQVLNFCGQVQKAFLGSASEADLIEERGEVLKLLSYANISPAEIGFNPDQWTHVQFGMDFKKRTFELGAGQSAKQ
jgi:hypothetical protein